MTPFEIKNKNLPQPELFPGQKRKLVYQKMQKIIWKLIKILRSFKSILMSKAIKYAVEKEKEEEEAALKLT